MEPTKIIVQRLKKDVSTDMDLAMKYYSILSAINNLHLTEREIQLVSFTAIKGNITYANVREEFCKTYNSTSPSINNIISKLKKVGIFIKENGKVKVNPVINSIDFKKDLTLEIKLVHGEANINVSEGVDHQEDVH
jgi:TATA-box binding protein (TBP) (component of TFIID and TFIIIB)